MPASPRGSSVNLRKSSRDLLGLSKTQWLACVCSCTFAVSGILPSLVLGPAAFSPATVIGYKMAQWKRRRNLGAAQDSGNVEQVVSRWDRTFFKKRGLVCRVDLPRQADDMAEMDLASSALYEYQVRTGEFSSIPGILVTGGNPGDRKKQKKERKLQSKEGHYRQISAQRMRIVLAPIDSPHDMSHRYDGSLQGKQSAYSHRRLSSKMEPHGADAGYGG